MSVEDINLIFVLVWEEYLLLLLVVLINLVENSLFFRVCYELYLFVII